MTQQHSFEAESRTVKQDPVFKTATFAAGCFWGVEEVFRRVPGVVDVTVGYTGGSTDNPTYGQVCTGATGHAEAVRVIYNPALVSYERLLSEFWQLHDPTQLNRQGPDIGTQYRSVIFYHDEEQRVAAEASKEALDKSGSLKGAVVTRIQPAGQFWTAEEYHQRYLAKCGRRACS
jgi:peptide-methionine (S)-S-oxide reductase